MEQLSEKDKERLIQFIKENDLDFTIVNGDVIKKFHIIACDKIKFFPYTFNGEYIIVKYDQSKDKLRNPGSCAYEYYNYKSLIQILEQLKYYDDIIPKSYWYPTTNSAEIGFDKDSYVDDWYNHFKTDDEYSSIEMIDDYKSLIYNNPNYNPKIKSPFNTIHEVSPLNSLEDSYTIVNKLYFEIHPISCKEGNETYLLKLLSNNEEVLKEFINYIVTKKKGLKMLMEEIFKSVETFKNAK